MAPSCCLAQGSQAKSGWMPSLPHTLVWAHPRGPWTMSLPEAHALSPWQGHPTGTRHHLWLWVPACLGVQNVGGGFERVLP